MGDLISLPFRQVSHLARDFGSVKLDYPQTEISVHYTELKQLQAAIQRFFREARTIRKYSLPKLQRREFQRTIDITETEMNNGPKARPTFPFFVKKKEMIDLDRILGLFDKLTVPPDFQLDYFFNCLPNFMTGDGVYTLPVFYIREQTDPPMPILVADMELDFKELTRAAMRRLAFEKSAAGYFQMALLYKILMAPEGLINVNPVYDWEGLLFPGRERLRGWLQNIAAAISRVDYARLWDLDTSPAVWHAGGRALVKFDVLEPNYGYFQHYCFFRSDRIVDFESLSLVRIEPSVFF
jgi:hypothetical protein